MAFTLVHGLISYFASIPLTQDTRLRRLAFIAGLLPDLDGLPILWGDRALFLTWHHGWMHSPFTGLLAGIILVGILFHFYKNSKNPIPIKFTLALFVLAFALHPITDVLSSDWPINFGWPFIEINGSSTNLGIPDQALITQNGIIMYTRNDAMITTLAIIILILLHMKNKKYINELVPGYHLQV